MVAPLIRFGALAMVSLIGLVATAECDRQYTVKANQRLDLISISGAHFSVADNADVWLTYYFSLGTGRPNFASLGLLYYLPTDEVLGGPLEASTLSGRLDVDMQRSRPFCTSAGCKALHVMSYDMTRDQIDPYRDTDLSILLTNDARSFVITIPSEEIACFMDRVDGAIAARR